MAQDADQKNEDSKIEDVKKTSKEMSNVMALPTPAEREAAVAQKTAEETVEKLANKTVVKKVSKKKTAKKANKVSTAAKTKKTVTKQVKGKVGAAAGKSSGRSANAYSFTTPFAAVQEILSGSELLKTNQMEAFMSQSTAQQFDKITADAAKLSRENLDAFVKSSTLFAKGFEEISREAIALSQGAAEKQAELAQAALASKTINEFVETQSKIAQASFDDFMKGATKLSEMSIKVLTEASEPLNSQMNKAMQKVNKAA